MKPMSFGLVLKLTLSSVSLSAWADFKSSIPQTIQLHVAPQRGWSGSTATVPPTAVFSGFQQADLGKYLTVTTGPEFINLISGRSASFTGLLAPDKCTIVDAPLNVRSYDWDSKIELYKKQTRQLQKCVQLRVHDAAGVRPAPEQSACKITPVNTNEVIASGGVCYFQISSTSNLTVNYEVNPECQEQSRFADLDLAPLDIFAFTGFYVSGDASGQSLQLRPLGSTGLRFTIEPSEQDVRLSTDMGDRSPRWPVVAYPDVHMGAFEIYQRDGQPNAVFITNVFTENECMSPDKTECNFGFPLGMQISLSEIRSDGRPLLLDQWYSGGIAPAFWQGFLPASRELPFIHFRAGQRYRLEADLTYLSMYHRLFKEGFKNFLVSLGYWTIDPNQPMIPLRPVSTIPRLTGLKPNAPLPDVSPLTAGGSNDISLELNRMRSMLTDVNWPPYYEQMCGSEGCVRALSGQARLKVGVEFTVEGFSDGKAKTSNYRVWRSSSFLPEYDLQTNSLMRPECQ